jgi:hypothetical protein
MHDGDCPGRSHADGGGPSARRTHSMSAGRSDRSQRVSRARPAHARRRRAEVQRSRPLRQRSGLPRVTSARAATEMDEGRARWPTRRWLPLRWSKRETGHRARRRPKLVLSRRPTRRREALHLRRTRARPTRGRLPRRLRWMPAGPAPCFWRRAGQRPLRLPRPAFIATHASWSRPKVSMAIAAAVGSSSASNSKGGSGHRPSGAAGPVHDQCARSAVSAHPPPRTK